MKPTSWALAGFLLLPAAASAQFQVGEVQRVRELNASTDPVLDPLIARTDDYGTSFAPLGDLDGNGATDVAVGAPGASTVWVLLMNPDGTVLQPRALDFKSLLSVSRMGTSLANLGDVDGDGVTDLAIGRNDSNGPGHFWIAFLNSDGTLKAALRHDPIIPAPNGQFGIAVCALGDQNQDGVPDLAVGEPGAVYQGVRTGLVWLLFLNRDGSIGEWRRMGEGLIGFPGQLGMDERFGESLTALGDRDGNGVTDLAVGAPAAGPGEVWVVHLRSKGKKVLSAVEIGDNSGGFTGSLAPGDRFGDALTAGDGDGDGELELFVGAPLQATAGQEETGAVWALDLAADGSVLSRQRTSGLNLGDDFYGRPAELGGSLGAWDREGDGTLEILAGTHPWLPRVYSYDVQPNLMLKRELRIDSTTDGLKKGLFPGDAMGRGMTSLGDLDSDGFDELAVHVRNSVWVFFFQAGGSLREAVPLGREMPGWPPALGKLTLRPLEGGCDIDGDGIPDLLVEATEENGADPAEGVWALFLDSQGSVRSGAQVLATKEEIPSALGDVDGDGFCDLVSKDPSNPSAIRVHFLRQDGSVRGTGPSFVLTGSFPKVKAVEALGDLDGDGSLEFAATHGPILHVLSASPSGAFTLENRVGPNHGWGAGKVKAGQRFGDSLAAVEDLNHDGVRDLLVGSPGLSLDGGSWVLLLRSDGTVDRGVRIDPNGGGETYPMFSVSDVLHGTYLAALGDLDGDGTTEVAHGEPSSDFTTASTNAGEIFVASLSRGLWSVDREHSIATGEVQTLWIDAGPEHAGRVYQVFGSLAGTAPGFATSGRGLVMPLNDDGPNGYLILSTLYPNGLFLGDGLGAGFGLLNVKGRATARFTTLPVFDPALVGTEIHHAFAVFDPYPTEVVFTSNAMPSVLVD